MSDRLSILTALNLLAPHSAISAILSFLFWEGVFTANYLLILNLFGQFDRAPLAEHVAVAMVAAAPFVTISMWIASEHMHLGRKLRSLARQDLLTGLPNRHAF